MDLGFLEDLEALVAVRGANSRKFREKLDEAARASEEGGQHGGGDLDCSLLGGGLSAIASPVGALLHNLGHHFLKIQFLAFPIASLKS
ncbi:hypothetical protein DVH24_011378 [Malus domestica]|uniref:Uncharacterized protein n=1 Tax=Malus domestica TaxID=3750 RepID=A0A498JYH2_MALDO|nr:hypothetical protein DVH24_011378 [Malus domestica]